MTPVFVRWGSLGSDWIETTLGEVAEVKSGGTPSTSVAKYWDGNVIWVTPTDLTSCRGRVIRESSRSLSADGLQASSASLVPAGSVLMTSRATIGVAAIAGVQLALNQGVQALIPGPRVDPTWLYYWVLSRRDEFVSLGAGTTFPEVSRTKTRSVAIALPPLAEQRRVADLISNLDDALEALQESSDQARSLHRSLIGSLYEDLDANEMKLDGLVELHNNLRVPVKADDRATMKGSFPYCGANGVVDHIDDYRFDGEFILLAEDGGYWGADAASAYEMRGKFWVNNHAHVLTPCDLLDRRYLLHALNHIDMTPWITGTTRGKLTTSALKQVKIKVPDLKSQLRVASVMDANLDVIDRIADELTAAEGLRASLISALSSGDLALPASYDRFLGASENAPADEPDLVSA